MAKINVVRVCGFNLLIFQTTQNLRKIWSAGIGRVWVYIGNLSVFNNKSLRDPRNGSFNAILPNGFYGSWEREVCLGSHQ